MKNIQQSHFARLVDHDLTRMQELLTDDTEIDAAALHELGLLAHHVAHSAHSVGLGQVTSAADTLARKTEQHSVPHGRLDVLAKLELWHLLIRLKTDVKASRH
ncbi:MAG: hypothetical protein ABI821_03675 [Pseudomonadota bacterium]